MNKEKEKAKVFKTVFHNKRPNESAQIMFCDRPSGLFVPPNSTFELESESPLELYSRYSKVQFLRNGDLLLTERGGWAQIEKNLNYGSPYVCKFWNRDGANWVSIYLGGELNKPTLIPRGIPRFLALTIDSTYVKFKEYRWEFQLRKEPIEGTSYFTETWGLRMFGVERPAKELKEIGELIKKREMENATKTAEQNVNVYLRDRGLS